MATADSRSIFKVTVIVLGLIILLVYGYFQAREFITGPKLELLSPQSGETIASTSPEVVVQGHARNISFLTINGRQIFTDEKGDFGSKLLLAEGYTIITVEAQDKFKRSVKRELQLIVK